MERLLSFAPGLAIGVTAAISYAFFALLLIALDRFRPSSTSKDDSQVELKVLVFALALIGLALAAGGVTDLMAIVLSGFKGGGDAIKRVLAPIVVGAGVMAAMLLAFLPRTNATSARGPEALALLAVGLYFGGAAIVGGYGFLNGLVLSAAWSDTAAGLATLVVDGGIGLIALGRLGALAGWSAPVRRQPPGYPPQGYPPQGGGYPPQGGGYPPQGGGYPPQGGGYPPQGGGYPPQGGGYPPQGGYPPR